MSLQPFSEPWFDRFRKLITELIANRLPHEKAVFEILWSRDLLILEQIFLERETSTPVDMLIHRLGAASGERDRTDSSRVALLLYLAQVNLELIEGELSIPDIVQAINLACAGSNAPTRVKNMVLREGPPFLMKLNFIDSTSDVPPTVLGPYAERASADVKEGPTLWNHVEEVWSKKKYDLIVDEVRGVMKLEGPRELALPGLHLNDRVILYMAMTRRDSWVSYREFNQCEPFAHEMPGQFDDRFRKALQRFVERWGSTILSRLYEKQGEKMLLVSSSWSFVWLRREWERESSWLLHGDWGCPPESQ